MIDVSIWAGREFACTGQRLQMSSLELSTFWKFMPISILSQPQQSWSGFVDLIKMSAVTLHLSAMAGPILVNWQSLRWWSLCKESLRSAVNDIGWVLYRIRYRNRYVWHDLQYPNVCVTFDIVYDNVTISTYDIDYYRSVFVRYRSHETVKPRYR